MPDNPELIQHRERMKQLINFKNMRIGSISPTDLDGLIEYQDKCFIFIELKYGDAEIPKGQKLALERLTDLVSMMRPSVLIVGTHNTPIDIDIDMANTRVREYYYKRRWIKDKDTTMGLVSRFIKLVEGEL